MADEQSELDTSTHGLTVRWLDKYDSFGILHANSYFVVAEGWARREDAVAAADCLDGVAPWAATAAKLRELPEAVVFDVAFVVSEAGGTFLTRTAPGAGGSRG